ncbi:MAG: hypothetical protein HOV80_03625 [Polyangiaceae bacterium]|nr:hypothetical protein [Polyangiaceae bacterium]
MTLVTAFACSGKADEQAKATAEIRGVCEKLVPLDEQQAAQPEEKSDAPKTEGILATFRGLVDVLGSSPPPSVSPQTRCSADLHLYWGASEKGFACIKGCANEGSYTGAKTCVDKCVAEDEALETARRSSRKQREVTARDWLWTAAGKPMTTSQGKIGDARGVDRGFSIDLPDQPQAAGPGRWSIERTGALQTPWVTVKLVEPIGDFRDSITHDEVPARLFDFKERTDAGRYLLARTGPDMKMSRDPENATHKDRLVVQVAWDEESDRIICGMDISILDMDEGLIKAGIAWTENMCASVKLKQTPSGAPLPGSPAPPSPAPGSPPPG